MGKIGRMLDPANIIGLNKKKKAPPPIITPVPKQGSDEEVAQRRAETAARLRNNRGGTPIPDEDDFINRPAARRSKLFGE